MKFGDKDISFTNTHIMGVVNVTPDSMSDAGCFMQKGHVDLSKVFEAVEVMIEGGATFIDVGGESTRPGFESVSEACELDRVVPVIEGIASRFNTVVSIDTSKAAVMKDAVKAGALLVNDVKALSSEGAMACCANINVPVILMHSLVQRADLHSMSSMQGLIVSIKTFFEERISACLAAGISRDRLILDPGFGFGKKVNENVALMGGVSDLKLLGVPMAAGLSRKKTISTLLGGRRPEERLAGSLALAVLAYQQGVDIIRTHDVKETVDAIKVATAFTV